MNCFGFGFVEIFHFLLVFRFFVFQNVVSKALGRLVQFVERMTIESLSNGDSVVIQFSDVVAAERALEHVDGALLFKDGGMVHAYFVDVSIS